MNNEFGKCACCDKDALAYCHARNAWTCDECFLPQNEFPIHAAISRLTAEKEAQAERIKGLAILLSRAKRTLEPYPTVGKLKAIRAMMRERKDIPNDDVEACEAAYEKHCREMDSLYRDIEQALKGGAKENPCSS